MYIQNHFIIGKMTERDQITHNLQLLGLHIMRPYRVPSISNGDKSMHAYQE